MNSVTKIEEKKQEVDYYRQLANIASKSGTAGMTPEVMLNIMLTAKDLGISPMKAINGGFYVLNNKIGMSTALMADRIRKEGHSIKIPEWNSQKCVIIGVRKDNGDSVKFEFTMEDAVCADLVKGPTWKKYPKQMLYNRAMSTLARTLFPDVVGNAYSEDEKWDILDIPPEKRPMEDPEDASTIHIALPEEASELPEAVSQSTLETLKSLLIEEDIDTEGLESYLNELSQKRGQPLEKIIAAACNPQLFDKFKSSYVAKTAQSTH